MISSISNFMTRIWNINIIPYLGGGVSRSFSNEIEAVIVINFFSLKQNKKCRSFVMVCFTV